MSEEKPTLERQTSESLSIPERRVVVKDAGDLPTSYSTTPGGTMFSTTPGGEARIVRCPKPADLMSAASGLIVAHHVCTMYCTCGQGADC